jgi:hypothetical protein
MFEPGETPAVRARKQRGQAIVELAIAMPVLLWLTLGTLDFGRVFFTYIGLTNAAREGAQQATVLPHACDTGASGDNDRQTLLNRMKSVQPGLLPPSMLPATATEIVLFPAARPPTDEAIVVVLDCSVADRRKVTIGDGRSVVCFDSKDNPESCSVPDARRHFPQLYPFPTVSLGTGAWLGDAKTHLVRLTATATMPVLDQ